jgi:hypothetical protein
MTKQVSRRSTTPKLPVMAQVMEYLTLRWEAAEANNLKKKYYDPAKADRSDIIAELKKRAVEDETTGHLVWEFPNAIPVGKKSVVSLTYQRQEPDPELDTDAAKALLSDLGLTDDVAQPELVYDWSQLYVLNQQGKISDKELDELFTIKGKTKWSLTVQED